VFSALLIQPRMSSTLCLIALHICHQVQIHKHHYSADIDIPLTQPFRVQLYVRCACARGRPAELSASILQSAADATLVFQQLSMSAA